MFWLEERHTLIFRPAFSICFPLLLSPPPPPIQRDFPHNPEPASFIVDSLLLWLYLYIFSPLVSDFPWTSVHCPASRQCLGCCLPSSHPCILCLQGWKHPCYFCLWSPSHRQALPTTGPILFSLALLSPEKSIAHSPGHTTFERVPGRNAGFWQTETKIKGRRI